MLPCLFFGLFGLLLGSFLNVCIVRLPVGESVVWPRSHCRQCDEPIANWDNVPVLSWLLLGGACRKCGGRISWRYPLIELAVCILFLICCLNFSFGWLAAFFYCVAAALCFGALGSPQFTDQALADPLVQKFMALIEIRQADDLPDNGLFPAAVEVRLADGHSDTVRCDIPPGAPAMPMSEAEADRKYRSCASVVLDGAAIERTRAMILGIDRLADVGELCVALEGGGRP